jgi:hypothetical protein
MSNSPHPSFSQRKGGLSKAGAGRSAGIREEGGVEELTLDGVGEGWMEVVDYFRED